MLTPKRGGAAAIVLSLAVVMLVACESDDQRATNEHVTTVRVGDTELDVTTSQQGGGFEVCAAADDGDRCVTADPEWGLEPIGVRLDRYGDDTILTLLVPPLTEVTVGDDAVATDVDVPGAPVEVMLVSYDGEPPCVTFVVENAAGRSEHRVPVDDADTC